MRNGARAGARAHVGARVRVSARVSASAGAGARPLKPAGEHDAREAALQPSELALPGLVVAGLRLIRLRLC